jgi:hypothetical protein
MWVGDFIIISASIPDVRPARPPVQSTLYNVAPEVERPQLISNHSPLSNAEDEEKLELYFHEKAKPQIWFRAGIFVPPLNISYIQWKQCQFTCRLPKSVRKKNRNSLKTKATKCLLYLSSPHYTNLNIRSNRLFMN